jgi:hypothetical protein
MDLEFSMLSEGKFEVFDVEFRTSGFDLTIDRCSNFCNNKVRVRLQLLLDINKINISHKS